jgi:hypothetical protein
MNTCGLLYFIKFLRKAANFMDNPTQELVREWLTKALHDLQTARIVADTTDGPLDTAIYHCQQAAEKSVKAWLQSKDDPFPKTHDIEDLAKRASLINPDFGKLAKDTLSATYGHDLDRLFEETRKHEKLSGHPFAELPAKPRKT